MISDMFPDSEIAKKYEGGKPKTQQIIKGKGNQSSVPKKSNMHSVCLRR